MNIFEIIETKEKLEEELRQALSTMEKKNTIYEIRKKIQENQNRCPHFDNKFILTWIKNTCPYCGKLNCIKPEE